jgi:hypothetical protein
MSSEVNICNEALTALGENTILSLTDDSKAARLCNLKYATKRDYLLRRYNWNFAAKRVILAPDVNTPVFEYSAQFTLPTDCIQFREVYPTSVVYTIENNKIMCDESILSIKYTTRITDVVLMDISFREALSVLIARELAFPIADSDSKFNKMDELYEVKLSEARFAGSIEDDLKSLEADNWLEERF